MRSRGLAQTVRDLAPRLASRDAADSEHYPAENIADLVGAGVIRAPFPVAAGGAGCTLVDAVDAVEVIASASPSTALLASMPIGLAGVYATGPNAAPPEHRRSWAEQIEQVAADYRAGALYAACNSEKGAGGSLAATKTIAEQRDGRFELTGEKILASFGRHADMFFSTAKVNPSELPGCGVVEFFFVRPTARGVQILDDWDGFGMRSTESQTVRYNSAPAEGVIGFPNFVEIVQPLTYWFVLFSAIPLGCAAAIRRELSTPAPESPALRLRFTDAQMREEALRAYLHETARDWRAGAGPAYAARALRTKTYVTQEATRLCGELFALSGGRHYKRDGRLARTLAASFAGTALRPPLPLALDTLLQQFSSE
ncbi:MAG: acyl-CoA dehydrogenase [Acidobacteria bacterium]|nr:MAG: acyl-CoA dehydrogenase [Acidobacteriota bacterium]